MKSGLQFDSKNITGTVTFVEHSLPISVARDEIVKLHKISITHEHGVVAATSMRAYFSLKSVKVDGEIAPEDENELIQDKHTFWRVAWRIGWTVDGFRAMTYDTQVDFNPPIYLVRQPRVVYYGGSSSPSYLNVFCYYTKEKIGAEKLTRLMVQKHH